MSVPITSNKRRRNAQATLNSQAEGPQVELSTPRRNKRQRVSNAEISPPPLKDTTRKVRSSKKVKVEESIEVKVELDDSKTPESTPGSKAKPKAKAKVKKEEINKGEEPAILPNGQAEVQPEDTKSPHKKIRKAKFEVKEAELKTEDASTPSKPKRKRKTQEEKDAEAMPLAARTSSLRMFIGAHVSASGGVQNTPPAALHIGANAFAMFLKSQRKWENPPLKDEHHAGFLSACKEHVYDQASHVLPHGSYLVNLAQMEPDKAKQAYGGFIDDLERCERLGIRYYNFHPGWTGGAPRKDAIGRIAAHINTAHKTTKTVVPVLETMAGSNNVIGSTFTDLAAIIDGVNDKSRIGVCLDTCHVFAAGYDLRSPTTFKAVLQDFDDTIGIEYLKALHLNDSKAQFGSHRDLHQNIGLGFLGLRAFHNVMNEPQFENLPMVLETPIDRKDQWGKDIEDKKVWAAEIKLLESLIGMDPESPEFLTLEAELAAKGKEEREKMEESVRKKEEKESKKKGSRKTMEAWMKGKGKKGSEEPDSPGR